MTMAKSRIIDRTTPAGAALTLAYEMHERKVISIADLRCFEAALADLADKEAEEAAAPGLALAKQAVALFS